MPAGWSLPRGHRVPWRGAEAWRSLVLSYRLHSHGLHQSQDTWSGPLPPGLGVIPAVLHSDGDCISHPNTLVTRLCSQQTGFTWENLNFSNNLERKYFTAA